jgi:6,7-dimethyl-8-ribityllumazine synthase
MATESRPSFDPASLPKVDGIHRVGVVVSKWNPEITHALRDGALAVLKAAGMLNIYVHEVPGAFELPLGASWLLNRKRCQAVIAIGSVVRGETAHFDYVCASTANGLMNLGLSQERPVIFCVLTDDNIEQSRARAGGALGNKGEEAALACLQMLALKAEIDKH